MSNINESELEEDRALLGARSYSVTRHGARRQPDRQDVAGGRMRRRGSAG